MKFICLRDCFFNGRLFKEGEEFRGAEANKNFAPAGAVEKLAEGKPEGVGDEVERMKAEMLAGGYNLPHNASRPEKIAEHYAKFLESQALGDSLKGEE